MSLLDRGTPQNLPGWLFFLKIAILLLSIIVLAMSAWSLSLFLDNQVETVPTVDIGDLDIPDVNIDFEAIKKRTSLVSLIDDASDAYDAADKAPALMLFVVRPSPAR